MKDSSLRIFFLFLVYLLLNTLHQRRLIIKRRIITDSSFITRSQEDRFESLV